MRSKNQSVDLGTGSIGKLLFSLALPSIIAQLINVLYNVVDRMYIGHIPETGALALTGVGVTMPIILMISAFSSLVCMGGSPRAAIELGKGNKQKAEEIMGNCFILLVLFGILLTFIAEVFGEWMLLLFGASQSTLPYALDYLRIYALGTLFVQSALGMNMFINTQGYAKYGMATVVIGAVINILLDPIFIFVFGMGVKGAACATILSQAVSALFVLWFLRSSKSSLHLQKRYFKLTPAIIGPCLMLGLSPFVMNITESLLSVCFNSSLLRYGGDVAVGAMAILASVMQFSMLPLQGLTQGSQPLISYNYGARKYDRIRKTFKILLVSALLYSSAMWALAQFMPQLLAHMFTNNAELVEYTCWAIRIYMAMCFCFGAQIACQQTFIALGNAKTSLFLALLRKVFLLIPLIYILPSLFENKVFAVFLAEPVADTLAVATTCILFARYYKKVLLKEPK
ncbi:MATE family efflux transporter [Dubosiella newyorkensis]|uniref:MATE family efflux transporter n=1 Tax=Dubosiella newyorkensis TaxID=1862672 RepID=UPI0032B2AB54